MLWDSQIQDLGHLLANPRHMHLSEPGTGKTPTCCTYAWYRYKQDKKKTVWVMPAALMHKNKQELLLWTPFEDHEVQIGWDFRDSPDVKVWIMTPARYRMVYKGFTDDTHLLLTDEHHKGFSTHGSKTTEALYWNMRRMDHFTPMTGTLLNGRLDSAYPAIHVTEPRFYPNHTSFLVQHAYLDDYDRPFDWHSHDRLGEVISRISIQRSFAEVHGKKNVVYQTQNVALSDKHRALYQKFHDEGMLALSQFDIHGGEPSLDFIRARQILEHPHAMYDPLDRKKEEVLLKGEKLTMKEEALMIHFEDHVRKGTPVLVFSSMVNQQHRVLELMKMAGIKNPTLMIGATSDAQRAKNDLDFQAGRIQGMVVSQEVAGFGFNWQFWGPNRFEVEHCIFLTLTFMDSDITQSYGRCIRGPRATPLRVTFLRYHETVDTKVYAINTRKSKHANRVNPERTIYNF